MGFSATPDQLTDQLAHRLGIQRDDIHTLTSVGIVDISESDELAFHHRQHYLFFAEFYGEAPPALARMLLEAIETSGRSEQYPFQRVALREGLGQLTDSDLLAIAAVVIDKTNTGPARRRATPLLLEVFNRPDLAVDPRVETYARLAAEQEDSRDNQSCHPWSRCRQKSTIELMPRDEFLTLA